MSSRAQEELRAEAKLEPPWELRGEVQNDPASTGLAVHLSTTSCVGFGSYGPVPTEARAAKVVTTDRVNAPLRRENGGRRELLRVAQEVCWRHVEPTCHPLDCGEPDIPLCVLHAADPCAVHAAGATARPHRQPLPLALAAHVQPERLSQPSRRQLRFFVLSGRRPLAEVLGEVPVRHRSVEFDLDVLVDHPVGGCFVVRLGLGRDVVEGLVEQEPLGFATRALRQDDQAAVKAGVTTQRPEVRLVVRDEDGLLVENDRIEPLVKLSEQVPIAVACRPETTLVGSVDERR